MVRKIDAQARCAGLHPDCICASCANNRITKDGVRCCWEARRGKSYISCTRCAVKACPGYKKGDQA